MTKEEANIQIALGTLDIINKQHATFFELLQSTGDPGLMKHLFNTGEYYTFLAYNCLKIYIPIYIRARLIADTRFYHLACTKQDPIKVNVIPKLNIPFRHNNIRSCCNERLSSKSNSSRVT